MDTDCKTYKISADEKKIVREYHNLRQKYVLNKLKLYEIEQKKQIAEHRKNNNLSNASADSFENESKLESRISEQSCLRVELIKWEKNDAGDYLKKEFDLLHSRMFHFIMNKTSSIPGMVDTMVHDKSLLF